MAHPVQKNGKPIDELFGDHDFSQDVLFKRPKVFR